MNLTNNNIIIIIIIIFNIGLYLYIRDHQAFLDEDKFYYIGFYIAVMGILLYLLKKLNMNKKKKKK
jgi:hypothetical protein